MVLSSMASTPGSSSLNAAGWRCDRFISDGLQKIFVSSRTPLRTFGRSLARKGSERRNPFTLAHIIAEALFEETYEWIICPILNEGQIKAERFRYPGGKSKSRVFKAWWVVLKTYWHVCVAASNAGVASVVKLAVQVWKIV